MSSTSGLHDLYNVNVLQLCHNVVVLFACVQNMYVSFRPPKVLIEEVADLDEQTKKEREKDSRLWLLCLFCSCTTYANAFVAQEK